MQSRPNKTLTRLASWNVNGLRAAGRNGFLKWFTDQDLDVVALQEIKVKPEQLEEIEELKELINPRNYVAIWNPAVKPGYSGVLIYTKQEPLEVNLKIGDLEADSEGRVIELEFKEFVLINAYFPNSQRDHARLAFKKRFCKLILNRCEKIRNAGKNVILCGDYNIAHEPIDLKNPKQNENNAGYLPEERHWMSSFLNHGYVDTFRHFVKDPGHYTWWSYRPGVREKNIGWRIDYHCVNQEFLDRLKKSEIQPHIKGSDHCPIILTLR